MAARLACPACGAALTVGPGNAGRVVPCHGCGRNVRLPAAAPRPTTRSDADAGPRGRAAHDRQEPLAARRTLLWLWVLLGTGAAGAVAGGAVFLLAARKPADPPGPTAAVPATPEPPQNGPPTPDPPAGGPGPVPGGRPRPATDLPGLKFYLPCDAVEGGRVTEAVSGRAAGTGNRLSLVDGPRGRALRLTHDRKNANRHALDLSDLSGVFHVPAGAPFTLALWARRAAAGVRAGQGADALDFSTRATARHLRSLRLALLPGAPAYTSLDLMDQSDRADAGTLTAHHLTHSVARPDAWNHFALIRDGGEVRWLLNGADAPDALPRAFPGELRYDALALLRSGEAETVLDVADVCLFDRALTAAEFRTLTGQPLSPPPAAAFAAPKPPGGVPAATDFPGLRFYLPCDAVEGGAVREAVSGALVGRGHKLELVDGPRGRALRATAGGPGGGQTGLDLSAHAAAIGADAGRPLTLAVWVRTDDWTTFAPEFLRWRTGPAAPRFRLLTLGRYGKSVGFSVQDTRPGGAAPTDPVARDTRPTGLTKGWLHVAVTRDEAGGVRWAVDGTPAVATGKYPSAFRFDELGLGWVSSGAFTADYDEFCLFDRVLTDDEIRKLAGRAR